MVSVSSATGALGNSSGTESRFESHHAHRRFNSVIVTKRRTVPVAPQHHARPLPRSRGAHGEPCMKPRGNGDYDGHADFFCGKRNGITFPYSSDGTHFA